ncbi:MAG: M23 family metallopeptidase [Oscillospiraceae bacterium]|nr:M23 family metallopeptidase [Oscillospiraceae bacterium]
MQSIKIWAFIILGSGFFIVILFMPLFMGFNDSVPQLAASAGNAEENSERIEELVNIQKLRVPADLVMAVTTYISENLDESLERPYIFPALEFLVMHEIIKEFVHYDDEEGECTDRCGYETVETNIFRFKDEILGYIGIGESNPTELNAGNLVEKAQEAADEKAKNSDKDQIRMISFEPIHVLAYDEALKRCGIEEKVDREALLEIWREKYFVDYLEEMANELGLSFYFRDTDDIDFDWEIDWELYEDLDLSGEGPIVPLPRGTYWINSVYGEFGYRPWSANPNHTGIDLIAKTGTPIFSVLDGVVTRVVENYATTGYGCFVVIDHGGGVTTLYAHMVGRSQLNIGDSVVRGDVIGYVGNTGLSTEPHLHFEWRVNGTARNPRYYINF